MASYRVPMSQGCPYLRELASDAPDVQRHLTFVTVSTISVAENSGSHEVTQLQKGTESNACPAAIEANQLEGVVADHVVEQGVAAEQPDEQNAAVLEDLVTSNIDNIPW